MIVVEHDEETMGKRPTGWSTSAPAPESSGGVVAEGTPKSVMANEPKSLTGGYLRRGRDEIEIPDTRRKPGKTAKLVIEAAKASTT